MLGLVDFARRLRLDSYCMQFTGRHEVGHAAIYALFAANPWQPVKFARYDLNQASIAVDGNLDFGVGKFLS